MKKRSLLLGHSPDPDDAFMFYAMAQGLIQSEKWAFEHILQDIQTLNERVMRDELDISAISIHAYPYVQDHYALLNCGGSVGDGYGPMIVSGRSMVVSDLVGAEILVPGTMTTAFLVLNLLLGKDRFRHRTVQFDQIPAEVAAGNAQAGLIIHEGQLTYQKLGLSKVVDLGEWWQEQTGLPLPLGGNVIRRALGMTNLVELTGILHSSIQYGLAHRDSGVRHAMAYARDLDLSLADRFVGMYVNHWTLDYGEPGRRAVQELLDRGHRAGMVPACERLDFIRPVDVPISGCAKD